MDSGLDMKGIFTLFAAFSIGGALFASQPGGQFDRLRLVKGPREATSSSITTASTDRRIGYTKPRWGRTKDGKISVTDPVTTDPVTTDPVIHGSDTNLTPTDPTPTEPVVTDPINTNPNSSYPEETAIQSNFDINSELVPSWGTGAIPELEPGNAEGAFRFICNAGQLLPDDPIVYPGQPGRSHLHQFYGNLSANANSTYESLRRNGSSSCMSPLNRSAYWMPAMLDGKGNVVRPDYISIYYKRRPVTDPQCSLNSGFSQATGNCIPLPNGLRFVFGFNMLDPASSRTGAAYFNCVGQTGTQGHYKDIKEAMQYCPTAKNPDGSYNKLGAVINAPTCWDGKNLDSPDHRSHISYISYGWWGYPKCPDTHPYVIPGFTMGAWYTVDSNLGTWQLSSDAMMPNLTAGSTLHADWWGAWDNNVQSMWMDNCINKRLSCTGGDLGNGKQMRMFSGFTWMANPRLVPIPG